MGINNLLKFMKPYVESVHIKKYAGQRVGIDAYSWLHKGAYSCNMELCLDMKGVKKYQFLKYFMHRIGMLRHYEITPVVVFDGGSIPCKAATEDDRHRRRKTNLDMAMEKLKEGDRNAASELFSRAVSITPQIAHQLIQVLRSENIEFFVAPYEADAQLAYLSGLETEKGGIAAIISEDSDLLAYGCPAVVFKMDRYGNGEEIILKKALNVASRVPSFMNFDRELFTGMCVLAGCDFLPSVPGIGIVRAYNLIAKYRNIDRVLSVLKIEKGKVVPEDYATAFKQAMAVFKHARVYDAASKKLKPLNPITPELLQGQNGDLDFLGPDLSPSIAVAIAEGNLDPCTMEAFNHFPQPQLKYKRSFPDSGSQVLTQKEDSGFMQEGCFDVVSCHKTIKKRIRGDNPIDAIKSSEEGKQMTITRDEEVLHKNETLVLNKLGNLARNEAPEEKARGSLRLARNIPCNNPFKKRKKGYDVQVNKRMATKEEEQASEVIEVEKSEILSATEKSEESRDSGLMQEGCLAVVSCHKTIKKRIRGDKPLDAISSEEGKQMTITKKEEVQHKNETLVLKKLGFPTRNEAPEEEARASLRLARNIPCYNPFKKRKKGDEVQVNKRMAIKEEEQASEVIEVEKSEILAATQKSVESIDSKFIKPKGKIMGQNLPKQSDCSHVKSKKCSILNFFSRV